MLFAPITKSKSVIVTFFISVFFLAYKAIDALGNVQFILQQLGVSERVARFLGSPRGIDFLVAASLLALVIVVAYQLKYFKVEPRGTDKDSPESPNSAAVEASPIYRDLQQQYVDVSAQLAGKKQQLKEESRKLREMTERFDNTEWLRSIAAGQEGRIQYWLDVDARVDHTHRLVGDDPYVDLAVSVSSRCVYAITLQDNLSGYLYFASQRLSKAPSLHDNTVKGLTIGDTKWFRISQPLTPRERRR